MKVVLHDLWDGVISPWERHSVRNAEGREIDRKIKCRGWPLLGTELMTALFGKNR